MGRITTADDLNELSDRDHVIETVSEVEHVKRELFARVGGLLVSDSAILVSNTPSIPIVDLGTVSGRAGNVMGCTSSTPRP